MATAVQFNWNTLNATNKSLDGLNQNQITLNSIKDEHYDDDGNHNVVNDGNAIIDNNDDPIMTSKIQENHQQQHELMFKEKLKSLLKVATATVRTTTTIPTINLSINNKKNEKLTTTSTSTSHHLQEERLPLNFNNENKCQHFVNNNADEPKPEPQSQPNETNHDNETAAAAAADVQLNNKLKNDFKHTEDDEMLEMGKGEKSITANTTAIFNDNEYETQENVGQQPLNAFKNLQAKAMEKVEEEEEQLRRKESGGEAENVNNFKGEYQTKYYAASVYSLSNTAFLLGQLPQLQLQPQQLQLFPQQIQQPTATSSSTTLLPPQEYHHLADYRFLFNPERHTEFFLHTLSTTGNNLHLQQQQQQRTYDASDGDETLGTITTTTTEEALYDSTALPPNNIYDNNDNDTDTDNDKELNENDDENENGLGMAMNLTNARFLNVVTDTIGAAFGVNTRPVAGIQDINTEEIELFNGMSLRQSRFNPFNPCRILIHGWLGGSNAGIYNTLVPEYFKLQDGSFNIITVDWGKGAIADYITASYRVKSVGMVVAKFIDFLHRETGISFENIHVIGFSMGAHIAGIAGKFVQTGRLPVIYGLDPALPLFRYENVNERLDVRDADYVEVIHTSVGSYGYDHPLGHADFYINYGYNQPGCFFNECSHFRAFQIYAASLSNELLEGMECFPELWLDMIKFKRCMKEMGQMLSIGVEGLTRWQMSNRRGVYFVNTNAQPPYRMG